MAIRPGKILTQHTTPGYTIYDTQKSPISLVVALDDAGTASGEFYADDGETQWAAIAPGKTVTYVAAKGKLSATVTGGQYTIPQKLTQVDILGVSKPLIVAVNGQNATWSFDSTVCISCV